MAVNNLLVKSYMNNIYFGGSLSFQGLEAKNPLYVEPVKEYAAKTLYIDDLNYARQRGRITQEEYDQTMAYKTESDPQFRPIDDFSTEEQV